MNDRRRIVKLYEPMILGSTFFGIDRDEVLDTLILYPCAPGTMANPAEEILEHWKMIDWDRSDTMCMEEFECMDVVGAVHAALAAARGRAEAFCHYARGGIGSTDIFTHPSAAALRRPRLVEQQRGDAA